MKSFDRVAFRGKFRDYQQAVLDRAGDHLSDKKIHIVAAPGSGKTILGLELIRRLGAPALVLSPSVTIRSQWGDRFGMYLPEGERIEDYVSFDLFEPTLITSVTYQALHAALNRLVSSDAGDDAEDGDDAEAKDFSSFDLIKTIRAAGIRTLCLDEAHHLRSEWQKALDSFVKKVEGSMTVVALTATPPYDSTPAEWDRYVSVCGEVDEEIFVPQLVAQRTLCPHQDYIYFNYPTEQETDTLKAHRLKAARCARGIISSSLPDELLAGAQADALERAGAADRDGARALLSLYAYRKTSQAEKLRRLSRLTDAFPPFTLARAEEAFDFILSCEAFTEESREKLRGALARDGLIERKKVCIVSNNSIDKMLLSSIGKLQSINAIVRAESDALGGDLRMLILTDYIKKDMMKSIGTEEALGTMGTVPIFESVRRAVGGRTRLALLSGSLVILPSDAAAEVLTLAEREGVRCSARPLEAAGYSEISFGGSNKSRVSVLTEAFGRGCFNVLIGTKSLLGEGWDSPCINSLILASFVGSFMLSNQMRGRAIRTDKAVPDKASNIWHLVTVEPELESDGAELRLSDADKSRLAGGDFETAKRRFTCFLAPAYGRDVIESGIERLDIIKPPFDREGVAAINERTLELASDRVGMARGWLRALGGSERQEVLDVVGLPSGFLPRGFFAGRLAALVLSLIFTVVFSVLFAVLEQTVLRAVFAAAGLAALIYSLTRLARFLRARNARKVVENSAAAVLRSLRGLREIESRGAKPVTRVSPSDGELLCMLSDASVREKRVFSLAMSELFSAVGDARYVLVRVKRPSRRDYELSFACPSVFAAKKEAAQLFAKRVGKVFGKTAAVYTRSDSGRLCLDRCRARSFLNKKDIKAHGRKIVRPGKSSVN